jgi:hypothetical protein
MILRKNDDLRRGNANSCGTGDVRSTKRPAVHDFHIPETRHFLSYQPRVIAGRDDDQLDAIANRLCSESTNSEANRRKIVARRENDRQCRRLAVNGWRGVDEKES